MRSPETITSVSSGHAVEAKPPVVHAFDGGLLRISHVRIEDHIAYSQRSERHLLHATLSGRARQVAGCFGSGDWTKAPERRGSISFTPRLIDRHGVVAKADIRGFELGLDHGFIEAACEQALADDWQGAFNIPDPKTFSIADMLASELEQSGDGLKVELLLLALGRRVGRTFGGARRPRDDGWLHPAALARIVEMLRSDPASPPRLAEMAREAGLGVSAFVRAFRGSTGSTPAAFARRLRLQQAAEILRSSRRSISETAAMQGFASASHLIQAFHSEHGVTPGRWRAQGDLRDGVPVRKSA